MLHLFCCVSPVDILIYSLFLWSYFDSVPVALHAASSSTLLNYFHELFQLASVVDTRNGPQTLGKRRNKLCVTYFQML